MGNCCCCYSCFEPCIEEHGSYATCCCGSIHCPPYLERVEKDEKCGSCLQECFSIMCCCPCTIFIKLDDMKNTMSKDVNKYHDDTINSLTKIHERLDELEKKHKNDIEFLTATVKRHGELLADTHTETKAPVSDEDMSREGDDDS